MTMEWQPIETAPKDGTAILVWNGLNSGFYTREQDMGVALWRKQAFPGNDRMRWCAKDCCDGVTTYEPTHWMPLPDPPQEGGKE
jgi:hypothetical protein